MNQFSIETYITLYAYVCSRHIYNIWLLFVVLPILYRTRSRWCELYKRCDWVRGGWRKLREDHTAHSIWMSRSSSILSWVVWCWRFRILYIENASYIMWRTLFDTRQRRPSPYTFAVCCAKTTLDHLSIFSRFNATFLFSRVKIHIYKFEPSYI